MYAFSVRSSSLCVLVAASMLTHCAKTSSPLPPAAAPEVAPTPASEVAPTLALAPVPIASDPAPAAAEQRTVTAPAEPPATEVVPPAMETPRDGDPACRVVPPNVLGGYFAPIKSSSWLTIYEELDLQDYRGRPVPTSDAEAEAFLTEGAVGEDPVFVKTHEQERSALLFHRLPGGGAIVQALSEPRPGNCRRTGDYEIIRRGDKILVRIQQWHEKAAESPYPCDGEGARRTFDVVLDRASLEMLASVDREDLKRGQGSSEFTTVLERDQLGVGGCGKGRVLSLKAPDKGLDEGYPVE